MSFPTRNRVGNYLVVRTSKYISINLLIMQKSTAVVDTYTKLWYKTSVVVNYARLYPCYGIGICGNSSKWDELCIQTANNADE